MSIFLPGSRSTTKETCTLATSVMAAAVFRSSRLATNTPIALPFTGIKSASGVAVNDTGTEVYVTDYNGLDNKVLKLSIPVSEPTTTPPAGGSLSNLFGS